MADIEEETETLAFLLPCAVCGRTFRPESLQKHTTVCKRNATKKRKTFDSSRQRIQGTELAEFLTLSQMQQKKTADKKAETKRQQSHWRQHHLEFMRAIRAARGVSTPVSPRSAAVLTKPKEHEKCPHCERHFGPKAFDRHIEWCREQKARIPKSPASNKAKERLEARTKYRAPVLRRVSVRDKYSPHANHASVESSPSSCATQHSTSKTGTKLFENQDGSENNSPANEVENNKNNYSSKRTGSSNNQTIVSAKRNNVNARKLSPNPAPPAKRINNVSSKYLSNEKGHLSPSVVKPNERNDRSARSSTSGGSARKRQPVNTELKRELSSKSTNHLNNEKKSSATLSSSEDTYNPFISAERQMMELLSDQDIQSSEIAQKTENYSMHTDYLTSPMEPTTEAITNDFHDAPVDKMAPQTASAEILTSSPDCIQENFSSSCEQTNPSPINSAFSKYKPLPVESPKWSDCLQEFDDLLTHGILPYDIAESLYGGSSGERGSSLSLCSLPFMDGLEDGSQRKISKIRAKMENASLQLQRSVALTSDNPVGDTDKPCERGFVSISEESQLSSSSSQKPSFLFRHATGPADKTPELVADEHTLPQAIHDVRLDAAEIVEIKNTIDNMIRIDSVEEELCAVQNVTEERQSTLSKHCGDSAYSSLNRRSPQHGMQETDHFITISSSGSESSLPPLYKPQVLRPNTEDTSILIHQKQQEEEQSTGSSRLSKFCHECGSRYPVDLAKFCCECGVRRLLI